MEVCCGSARYSAALRKEGFEASGVDWRGNKDRPEPGVPCKWVDLSTRQGRKELLAMLEDPDLEYVHFSPPCGTASRAREIRRKTREGKEAAIDPKPLRSDHYPDGLPGLCGSAKEKVQAANSIYETVAAAVQLLTELGVSWSIENPRSSLMWETSFFEELGRCKDRGEMDYRRAVFPHCLHGGERDKWTELMYWGTVDFGAMEGTCPGVSDRHRHKPWGLLRSGSEQYFATAEERRYPPIDVWENGKDRGEGAWRAESGKDRPGRGGPNPARRTKQAG